MKRKAKSRIDPKALLAAVGAGRTARDYSKNQTIFAQGDRAEVVFFVERGKVKLTVLSRQGKQAVIAILGPGNFFGEGVAYRLMNVENDRVNARQIFDYRLGILSLGSLLGSATMFPATLLIWAVASGWVAPAYLVWAAVGPVLIWLAHADNIERLIHGTERKFDLGLLGGRRQGGA